MSSQPYHISKNLGKKNFDDVEAALVAALKEVGFGVLTEIDVKATLKKKLDVDFRRYKILGACSPPFAHQALLAEPFIGILLPCNVLVQETVDGDIIASVTNPSALFALVGREDIAPIATEVETRLTRALESLA